VTHRYAMQWEIPMLRCTFDSGSCQSMTVASTSAQAAVVATAARKATTPVAARTDQVDGA